MRKFWFFFVSLPLWLLFLVGFLGVVFSTTPPSVMQADAPIAKDDPNPQQQQQQQTASENFWNQLKEELRKDKYSFLVEHSQIPIPVSGTTDATFDLSSFFKLAKDNVAFDVLSEEKKLLLQTWVNVHSIAKIKQGLANFLNSGQILWEQLSFLYPFVVDQDFSSEETSIELFDCDGNIFPLNKETGKGQNKEGEDISLFSTLFRYGEYSELSRKEKEIFESLIKNCISPEKVVAYKKPYVMWDKLRQFLASKIFIFSHLKKEFAENIDVGGKKYELDAFFPVAELDLNNLTSRYGNLESKQQSQIKKLTDGNVNWGRLKDALEKKLLDKIPVFWKKVKNLLKKPKYAHLSKTPIPIKKEEEEVYNGSLEPFFIAAKNTDSSDDRKWYELKTPNAIKIIVELKLVSEILFDKHFKPALKTMLLDVFWSGIKDELKKPAYSGFSSQNFIEVDGTEYSLEPLFVAAKDDVQYAKEGSELPAPTKNKLQELVDANITPQKLQNALKTALDLEKFWESLKSELKKDKYKSLINFSITVEGKKDNFTDLFSAAKSGKKISELAADERVKLRKLFKSKTSFSKLRSDLELNLKNEKLEELWSEIKDELKKPQYSDFEWDKKPIMIETRKTPELTPEFEAYFLGLLFKSANENKNRVSELGATAKFELDNLVNNNITAQKFKDALANTALDLLWSEIKSELKKPEYTHLSKTPILVNGNNYNLEPLFTAAKDDTQYAKEGSELPAQAKNKLQELVNDVVTAQKFKDALTATDTKNRPKLNNLWTGIKDELKKPEYAHLSKNLIKIGGTDYDLKPLFTAAKNDAQYEKKGSELSAQAKSKLQELVNDVVTAQKFKDALDVKNNEKLDIFWSNIKDELKKPEYTHLSKTPILVNGNNYKLEPLFAAAKDDVQYAKEGSELPVQAKNKLQKLVNAIITAQKLKDALDVKNNEKLDIFWSNIKDELKKPEYAHLSKILIKIGRTNYNLKPLFAAAKDDVQYAKEGSELPVQAKNKLQKLVNAIITAQKLKDALDVKNNEKLNIFWSNIKDELKKPEYAHLSKILIKIDGTNYNLEPLFAAAKDDVQYAKEGSELPVQAKNKLQELVNAVVIPQKFKDALDVKNNENLDTFLTNIKDELKKPEYAHLSKTLIKIDGKDYNLEPLFTAAKNDAQYEKKGSELPVQAKNKLQELVNAVVIPQKLKDALDVKNNEKLDTFWSNIKDKLKKPEYAHLSKTPITIEEKEYDLELLFVAAKDDTQYAKKGSELPALTKNKLQELVDNTITAQKLKDTLDENNEKNEEKDDQSLTVFLLTGGVILFFVGAFSFAFYFLREQQ